MHREMPVQERGKLSFACDHGRGLLGDKGEEETRSVLSCHIFAKG